MSKAGGRFPMTQLLATNSHTRSFGRSHANTRAISLPSSTPRAFDFWMVAATPERDANCPSNVGASVSSTVTSSVALATFGSPFAARWLGLALATGSFLFAEPLPAATPLAWGRGDYGQLGDGNFYTTPPHLPRGPPAVRILC